MTPSRTTNLLRSLFVIFSGTVGALSGSAVAANPVAGTTIGLSLGLLMVLVDRLLKGFSLRAFSSATFGLLLGLIAARLLKGSDVLQYLPEEIAWTVGLGVYVIFGYLGMMLAMRSNRDEFSLVIPYVRFSREAVHDAPIIVDSNILIDGRIIRVVRTGFLGGSVVVPNFIIDELQTLADSQDPRKRESGRTGLNNLSLMQQGDVFDVTIHEGADDSDLSVDQRLARLALLLNARLLTNDAPLTKVARLQHVSVLNLNELLAALRPPLSPGEVLPVHLTKPGRDQHQAVGYLDDGTMIVVNHARQHIGETVDVTISSTLKTSAGMLFFANLGGTAGPAAPDDHGDPDGGQPE